MTARPHTLPALAAAALLAAAPGGALAASSASVEACTLAGPSGEYSVRVRNVGKDTIARVEVAGVRPNASAHGTNTISVQLPAIPPGRYQTAILARRGESAALVSLRTYVQRQGAQAAEEDIYAGRVAHVTPGNPGPGVLYTLAPLAVRGWTVAYPSTQQPVLAHGASVLIFYPARAKPQSRPEAGRSPSRIAALPACGQPAPAPRR
ncbi:hypothetical protein [Achromobacter sp. Marseille-Q4962]|uniref:hypothetical protein n=1 Tax=Achromobacter sp. Marseille-Q4962 TaxID=2942202 RepID=UPI0020749D9C|nr:hypothetical protein [Achromobacter sp. Marseille-Q4962]